MIDYPVNKTHCHLTAILPNVKHKARDLLSIFMVFPKTDQLIGDPFFVFKS